MTGRLVRMQGGSLASLLALTFCLAPSGAHAVLRTWGIYGKVASLPEGLDPNHVIGSEFRMYFEIEDTTPDALPGNPNLGEYSQYTPVTFEFRHPTTYAASVYTDPSASVNYFVHDDEGSGPVFDLHEMVFSTPAFPIGWQLEFLLSSVLPSAPVPPLGSDALPSPPPLLTGFNATISLEPNPLGLVNHQLHVLITNFGEVGSLPAPILPVSRTAAGGLIVWHFSLGTYPLCQLNTCWIDPPAAPGYVYETDGASRFTAIEDFPSGFDQDFAVSTGGSSLGSFGPGDSVDFTGFPGGGVVEFTVTGINPYVDASDPIAFPLKISMNSSSANFTMTALPADVPALPPAGVVLLVLAVATTGGLVAWRRLGSS